MDESRDVKAAPLTRLRRRVSVESEGGQSPSTPSTPTKKRATRLAKPALELIDENVSENQSKRATRKSIAREVEPVEDKAVTPSRRSARIRSNTSLVLDASVAVGSPRAMRAAARRNSQLGSDTESTTPSSTIRRTRKDSTSSVEKLGVTNPSDKVSAPVAEPIVEEPEKESIKDTNQDNNVTPTLRKSPRINQSKRSFTEADVNQGKDKTLDSSKLDIKINKKEDTHSNNTGNLSITSSNLINDMKSPKVSVLSKTTSAIEETNESNYKHNKSWTMTNTSIADKQITHVNNGEIDIKSNTSINKSLVFNSVENKENILYIKSKDILDNGETRKLLEMTPSANLQSMVLIEDSDSSSIGKLSIDINYDPKIEEGEKVVEKKHNDGDQCVPVVKQATPRRSPRKSESFVCEPMDIDETIPTNVTINDYSDKTDSSREDNNNSRRKSSISEMVDSDQYLQKNEPNVLDKSNKQFSEVNNINESANKSKRNLSISLEKESNSSKRKSSIGHSKNDSNLNKSDKEKCKQNDKNNISVADDNDAKISVTKIVSESKRKPSFTQSDNNDSTNKSKRTSTSELQNPDTTAKEKKTNNSKRLSLEKDSNSSKRKSSIGHSKNDSNLNKSDSENSKQIDENNISVADDNDAKIVSESKRKSSFSQSDNNDSTNKSKRTSISELQNPDTTAKEKITNNSKRLSLEKDSNTSKRKSSIGHSKNDSNLNKSDSEKSKQNDENNISVADDNDAKIVSESKRKSSISQSDNNDSTNKPKRISTSESQNADKSANENKSTLILSQLKDVSINTGNVSKSNDNELSKSVIQDVARDKKNLSLNYFTASAKTSTPLQQKSLQKMQINSSIISNAEQDGKNDRKEKRTPKKRVSEVTENHSSDDDGNSMIDGEAEEASDEYESGDSRDAEERQYDEENEIIDKGETLESEKYFSDDEDYEKDSFVVSSDEEDQDLLSGSGDDLSLSDNELKMTAKSKKKYNDRKIKEQKRASKEMYNARHKIDTKKSKKQRLDSTSEQEAQPIKKNRLRIDSSHDQSDDLIKGKKKVRQLSESFYEEITNEKEITVNQSASEKNDPLLVAVKQEPKTPQKLDISTVVINNNIEEIQLNTSANKTNASIIKPNETSDPLQTTLAEDEDDGSESDISENMEIKQNYDSVLENLNKSNKKKKGTLNMSLNYNKKDAKDPIVDQLNLTGVKKNKKDKSQVKGTDKNNEKADTAVNEGNLSDSDLIDMKLLFPEDSNDSEVNAGKFVPEQYLKAGKADEFIPLKKSVAKTNVRESMDLNTSQNVSKLNVSKKKDKKRKSNQTIANDGTCTDEPDANLSFFIDTKGTYGDMDISVQNSAKKNKKKYYNIDLSIENNAKESLDINPVEGEKPTEMEETSAVKNSSLEVSITSDKKKKKNKNKNVSINEDNLDESQSQIGRNKSKTLSESLVEVKAVVEQETSTVKNSPLEVSIKSDKKKKKNKNKNVSINEDNLDESQSQIGRNKSKTLSESLVEVKAVVEQDVIGYPLEVSFKSDKSSKKKNSSMTNELTKDSSIQRDKKKKKKLYESESDVNNTVIETENVADTDTIATSGKKKKKKNKNTSQTSDEIITQTTEYTDNYESKQKKKKRKISQNNDGPIEDAIITHIKECTDDSSESKPKKKKRKISQDDDEAPSEERIIYIADENLQFNQEPQKKLKKNKKPKHRKIPNETKAASTQNKPKKRKADDDNVSQKISKVLKENSLDGIHIPRLPESIVNQLDDKPSKVKKQKANAIATTAFQVQVAKTRKNKPSNYLEESVYLNDSPVKKKHKGSFKKPKVLPFTPTVITSEQGYTSNFRMSVLPQETQFVAQANDIPNFRNEFLANQRVKKLGTFERFKKQRNYKIAKF